MSDGFSLLLLGLRGSGKTSFLAALWHLVEASEVPTSLRASELQPDREYLNRIRDTWLKLQEFGRTTLRVQETVSMKLADTTAGSSVVISVPDLSGELFRLQWVTRKATTRYAEFAGNAAGIFLFIHPRAVKKVPLIRVGDEGGGPSVNEEVKVQSGASGRTEQVARSNTPVQWSPDLSPTQVQLVELLQFTNWLRSQKTSPRIAVIVSAWDLVREPILPLSWVETRLPLLFQFLVANRSTAPFRIYGVSALGGDLEADLAQLQSETVAAHRIKVVDRSLQPHNDLTAPIRFLLGLDDEARPPTR